YTANWLTEHLKQVLEPFGITPTQFNILRILRGSKKPISTLNIRERMLDRMSDTSRLVDRLVAKGYVDKKVALSDKRLVDITITQKGLDLLANIDAIQYQLDNLAANLSSNEAAQLNYLLDKMRNL
ncbi:MAG: MarR family winged helix-turn-helix transcriptional regulator, partial [Chitinophagaceae bacterium]